MLAAAKMAVNDVGLIPRKTTPPAKTAASVGASVRVFRITD
jgi:hypothetical protein